MKEKANLIQLQITPLKLKVAQNVSSQLCFETCLSSNMKWHISQYNLIHYGTSNVDYIRVFFQKFPASSCIKVSVKFDCNV